VSEPRITITFPRETWARYALTVRDALAYFRITGGFQMSFIHELQSLHFHLDDASHYAGEPPKEMSREMSRNVTPDEATLP
jgi:hypothetical protein